MAPYETWIHVVDIDAFLRRENLARSVDLVNEKLRGTKRIDLFECARLDSRVSVEETIATLAKFKDQGKFDHIGMSECSAETLRRGHKVCIRSLVERTWIYVLWIVDSSDQHRGDRNQPLFV